MNARKQIYAGLGTLLCLLVLGSQAYAQSWYPLGLWFVDSERPYPGYVSDHEANLFADIHTTELIGCGYNYELREADYMNYCDSTGGSVRMTILGEQGTVLWPNLWHEYSLYADDYPDPTWISGVDRFIHRADSSTARTLDYRTMV